MPSIEETFFGSQCMFVCDQITFRILDVNDNGVALFGIDREHLLGSRLTDFGIQVSTKDPKFSLNQEVVISSDQVWRFELKNSEIVYFQFSSHLINYKGKPSKLIVAHDISASLMLQKEQQPLSSPVEFINFPMAEIEWNSKNNILRWSSKAEELFGWTQEEVINHPNILQEFVYPEDLKMVQSEYQKSIKERRKNASLVNRNITKNGDIIYCEWYSSYLFNDAGDLVSIYSLAVDVTEKVEADKRSKQSQQNYIDLFNSISDAIYLVNGDGIILIANDGTRLTFGYEIKDLIGKHFGILNAPGKFNKERFFEFNKDKLEKGAVKFEGWGKKKNGEIFPTEILVNSGVYFEEEVHIIIERDISERKFAEDELQKRENLLSELFNTSPLGIALLNSHNEVIELNKGFECLFGYSFEEIGGLELDRVIVPAEFMDYALSLTETPYVEEEVTKRLTKSGELIDVIIYAVPIIIDKKMVYKYGIYVDITDRKKAEEQLKTSLREKELLLAEVHHRVKNNLAVITGLLELQSYSTDDSKARKVLRDSQMRVHSIALVHEKLYGNEDFTEIKVHEYIKELSATVEHTMELDSAPIEISFDLDEIYLPITQAIPCGLLLNEVLTNSFKHAFVGQEEGKISVSFKKYGGELIFKISDNGIGFEKSKSKPGRNSLGMKLINTLSKQLIAQMNVDSTNGTVFEFKFKNVAEN
ncbi:MAG: PAS domain S-box protein [Balneolaceae bacterium]